MPTIPGIDPSQGAVPNYDFGAPPAGISFPTQSSGQSGIPVDPSLAALNAMAQSSQGGSTSSPPQQPKSTFLQDVWGAIKNYPKALLQGAENFGGSVENAVGGNILKLLTPDSKKGQTGITQINPATSPFPNYELVHAAPGYDIPPSVSSVPSTGAAGIASQGVPSDQIEAYGGGPTGSSGKTAEGAAIASALSGGDNTSGAMGVQNPMPLDKSGGMTSMKQMMDALAKSQTKNQAYKPSFLQILGNALQTAGRAAGGASNPTYLEGILAREQQMRALRSQQDFNLVKSTLDFRFNQQMQALNAQLQAHVITPAAYESQLGLIQQQYMNLVNQYSRTILATQQNLGAAGMTPTEQGILQQNATSPTGTNVNTAGIAPGSTPSATALNTPATGGTGVR